MKTTVLILTLLCVVTTAGCESLLETIRKPSARIDGVRFDGLSLEKVKLVFDIDVTNPYSFDIPLANLDYALSSEGAQFLDGQADLQGTSIPARGSRTVPVPVSVTFASLLKLLQKVTPGEVVPYESNLKLWLDVPNAGPLGIPLNFSGNVPVPALPEVELGEVKWGKLTLDEAGAVLHVRVKNRNTFPVDMTRMTYGLKFAGTQVAQSGFEEAVQFAGGGENTLEIPISISPKNFGIAFFRLLTSKSSSYELGGTMVFDTPFGKLDIPFTRTGETVFKRD